MITVSRRRGYVRLHMNESPYPPPPLAVEMLRKYAGFMNFYEVEHLWEELLDGLSRYASVDQRYIDVYPGSSAAISLMFTLASVNNLDLVVPHPTFFILYDLARAYNVRLVPVQLSRDGFELPVERFLRKAKGRLVYLANPNNPTSNLLVESEKIVAKLAAESRYLFLDEAYYEFSRTTFCSYVIEHDNAVVLRSLSKAFSLAGARIGYVVASPKMLRTLGMFRVGYEVPVASQAAALGALRSREYMKRVVEEITTTREWVRRELLELGLLAPESHTNFVYVKLPVSCVEVQRRLRRMGFLVMCFDGMPGLRWIKQHMRVTIGKPEDMAAFLEAMKEVLGEGVLTTP